MGGWHSGVAPTIHYSILPLARHPPDRGHRLLPAAGWDKVVEHQRALAKTAPAYIHLRGAVPACAACLPALPTWLPAPHELSPDQGQQ